MSKRPLVYWNILGEGARKASNANIDTSPKITINFLEEVGALQEVVGRRGSVSILESGWLRSERRSSCETVESSRRCRFSACYVNVRSK